MTKHSLGNTDLLITKLGFGAGHIGAPELSEAHVEHLLNGILDAGVNFIDTARGYGLSEERIGRYLQHRRREFILSTKVGYGINGYEDWTYNCIIAGVHQALHLLQTEQIDVVHLHSCPLHILQNNGVVGALLLMKEQGKIRLAAYSGENEVLAYALQSGFFDVLQTSVNIFDQCSRLTINNTAMQKGIGIIGKRPLGNCPWRYNEQPFNAYAEQYWLRMKAMELSYGEDWLEIAVRFAAWHADVNTIIAGTNTLTHFQQLAAFVGKGLLDVSLVNEITTAYMKHGKDWRGEI